MTKEERKLRKLLRECDYELLDLAALVKWWAPKDKVPRTRSAEKLRAKISKYFEGK